VGRSTRKTQSSKATNSEHNWKRAGLTIALPVIAVILIIAGVTYYINYVVPFQRTIITFNDTSISMRYFLKRAWLSGASTDVSYLDLVLNNLTQELLIKQKAPQAPYYIDVGPEDIDQELRRIARGENETISESEFKEWYRQQLNETSLSDIEYRDIISTTLMMERLYDYLAARVPTVAEQVHLYTIMLDTEDIDKIVERWRDGEELGKLSNEVWMDKQSEGKAEDLGWFPRGIISYIDYFVFDLNPGDVCEPLDLTEEEISNLLMVSERADTIDLAGEEGNYLFMVSEKAESREVYEEHLQILKARVLNVWLDEKTVLHADEIEYNFFDSETRYWIMLQLQRMQR